MQVWRLLYTNLVGPRGEKLESTEPFWSFFLFTSKWEFHMSFPRELCSCRGCSKGGSMDTMGDAIREVHLYTSFYSCCSQSYKMFSM
jgi:hypothetical protein